MQEYCSGLPFPPPGALPHPGIESMSPVSPVYWQVDSFPQSHLGSPIFPSGCEGKLGVALESLQGLRDLTSIPGSRRSPGVGNGNPLKYSCLGNPMDRGTWWATVHGVVKSQTLRSESETERKPEVPASPRGEALFRCARPSGVPRCPATSTGSLASQR